MLVSVAERTREIGVRKAIGAREKHIITQFLSESVLISFIGSMAVGKDVLYWDRKRRQIYI